MISEKQKGEFYIFIEALLWSLFPVITVLSFQGISSITALFWSSLFASAFFGIIFLWRGAWKELKNIEVWKNIFWVVLSIGVIYYSFYFIGLTKTSPGNASIIALFEVCTTFLLFHLLFKEKIPRRHIVGAVLMLIGAAMILAEGYDGVRIGDVLIFLATFAAPVGNYYQQKMKKFTSTETILFLRTVLSLPFVFLLTFVLGQQNNLQELKIALPFLIINGIFLLGASKIFWIEGIARISVPKAKALTSFGPFFTLIAAWLILGQAPTFIQLASLLPFIGGIFLLTDFSRRQTDH